MRVSPAGRSDRRLTNNQANRIDSPSRSTTESHPR